MNTSSSGVGSSSAGSENLEVFIVDVYNGSIFPFDTAAKEAIDVDVPLPSGTSDEQYLAAVDQALEEGFSRFPNAQICIYNAGTDILKGDPLGLMNVSHDAVVQRDAIVFHRCLKAKVPVLMVLSGGYTKQSTRCIADSIFNLTQKFGLTGL